MVTKSLLVHGGVALIVSAGLSVIASGDESFPRRPGMHTMTYVSRVDGSAQRYTLYLPVGFDPSAQGSYPLVFFGVGYGGTAGPPPERDWADKHGWIFAGYDGRHTHHYYGVADADFDQVLHDEIAAHYPVDLTRVYFIGSSMGASGAFGLGFRHPDWFASVAGAGGFLDYDEFWPRWQEKPIAEGKWAEVFSGPAWQRVLLTAWSPVHTVRSGSQLAPYIAAGERDTVNRTFASRRLAARIRSMHKYVEVPGGAHGAGYDVPKMLEWFRREPETRCMVPDDPHASLATNRLEFAKNRWVRITSLFSREEVSVVSGHRSYEEVEVTVRGPVRGLAVDLTGFGLKQPVPWTFEVSVNGRHVYSGPPRVVRVRRSSPGEGDWRVADEENAGRKTAGVEGPINHVFSTPFVIVYGSTERDREEAGQIAAAYNKTCYAEIEAMPDHAVSDDIAGRKSLVLVGTEGSNRWLAKMAEVRDGGGAWPLALTEETISIQGIERAYDAADHGVLLVHPSPFGGRYVLAAHGITGTRMFNFGCFMMFSLPDYVIFSRKEMSFVEAGLFDETWRTVRPDGGK